MMGPCCESEIKQSTELTILVIRLNSKLDTRGIPPMTSLAKDLSDGVRLIQLMVRLVG